MGLQKERRQKAKLASAAVLKNVQDEQLSSSDDDICSSESDEDSSREIKSTEKPLCSNGSEALVPHDILKCPKLVTLATRINLTPAQQACFTKSVIEESQADTSKVSLSYAIANRSRRRVNKTLLMHCTNHRFLHN